ncbi:hypothetical protein TWF751_005167 [Orbilia oligospora]|nr:hypothetical protein TWF751_005167 [Orbilia oligospora]
MIRTFQSLRFVLMVGIGGGAPGPPVSEDSQEEDIRLGDIVVGFPKDSHSGVLQYDMGKLESHGRFTIRSHLNKPPKALLTAVGILQSEHDFGEGEMVQYLQSSLGYLQKKRTKKLKAYHFPGRGKDLLFKADYNHEDNEKNCSQPYAALASAAYAKDLLRVVQPKEVENTKAIAEIVQELHDAVRQINNVTEHIELTQQERQRDEILRRLSPLEPQKRHQDIRSSRVPGTGKWLLDEPNFKDWCSGKNSHRVLCCSGIPGAGKSVLASLVIDHITALSNGPVLNVGIAFIYCDYRDQALQTPINLAASLLGQLLSIPSSLPQEVIEIYQKKYRKNNLFEQGDIDAMLLHACQQFDRAYICIDALDEAQNREALLNSLRKLIPLVQLFVTGRPHIPAIVERYFVGALRINIEATKDDIERFVATKIDEDWARDKYLMDENLKHEILGEVAKASQKMFLLPILQIQMVLDERTKANRRSALNKLPGELYKAFESTIDRIVRQSRSSSDLALDILMWTHLAERPLNVNELFDALAVKIGDKDLDTDNFPSRQSWLDCCLGLVIVDEETSTVRLVHFSLQEYLHTRGEYYFNRGHDRIAKTCLTYLCFDRILASPASDGDVLLRNFPFLDYAASQWEHHTRKEINLSKQSTDLSVSYLLQTQSSLRSSLVFLLKNLSSEYRVNTENFFGSFSGFHIAAYLGAHLEVFKLLTSRKPEDIDLKERYNNRTPLSYAVEAGHLEVVRHLIDTCKAKIDNGGGEYTTLGYAAREGHVEVVRLLVNTDQIDLNAKTTGFGETPLFCAAARGHFKVVDFLINTHQLKVNPSKSNVYCQTPLSVAAENGHIEVVKLLIEANVADINSEDGCGCTPLIYAALHGSTEIVRLLVNTKGVDINHVDIEGRTAFSYALARGYVEIAELLNTEEVDLNSKSWWVDQMLQTYAHVVVAAQLLRLQHQDHPFEPVLEKD